MKNKEWNTAFHDDIEQDWKAAMSSEVFRNFLKIAATEEQKEIEEKNKKKFKKDTDDIMKVVDKAEDDSKVPCPIIQNLPYDGDDFQEHVKRTEKGREKGSVYDEFYSDLKVYHKSASSDDEIISQAQAELAAIRLIRSLGSDEESEETEEESEDTEAEKTESPETKPIKPATEPTTKAAPKAPKAKSYSDSELYETDAGGSSHIDLGLTSETLRELSSGIDYAGDAIPGTHDIDIKKAKPESKKPDNKEDANKKELDSAEKDLGLDKSASYILSKIIRRG